MGFVFFIGALVGSMLTFVGVLSWGAHISKKEDNDHKQILKDIELMGSVKYRFTKVTEITDRQMDLIQQMDRPSASASHSRHKNQLVGELKALEQEKVDIFRSILKDGIDPRLSITIDGKPTTMKMSEAVAIYDSNNQSYRQLDKTESSTPRKNGLRLVSAKESMPDESHSPKIP